MIILDTNVVSETLRPKPSSKVMDWIGYQPSALLFTTTITEAELIYGIALRPRPAGRVHRPAAGWDVLRLAPGPQPYRAPAPCAFTITRVAGMGRRRRGWFDPRGSTPPHPPRPKYRTRHSWNPQIPADLLCPRRSLSGRPGTIPTCRGNCIQQPTHRRSL